MNNINKKLTTVFVLVGMPCSGVTTIYNKLIEDSYIGRNYILKYISTIDYMNDNTGLTEYVSDKDFDEYLKCGYILNNSIKYEVIDDILYRSALINPKNILINIERKFITVGDLSNLNIFYNITNMNIIPIIIHCNEFTRAIRYLERCNYRELGLKSSMESFINYENCYSKCLDILLNYIKTNKIPNFIIENENPLDIVIDGIIDFINEF